MATIIAFANQKGGVAKTTCTHNIGAALSKKGKKVLMIDLDAQASLTISVGITPSPSEYKNTIACVLKDKKAKIKDCIKSVKPNLDIVISGIELAKIEGELINATLGEFCLKRQLEPIKDEYDYILIDSPPQLSTLNVNSLGCADYVIIPIKTDFLAYWAASQLVESIEEVKAELNANIKIMGVIATMYEKGSNSDKTILENLKKEYNVIGIIKKTVEAKNSIFDGQSVVDQKPDSEISLEYNKIADYIIGGANNERK